MKEEETAKIFRFLLKEYISKYGYFLALSDPWELDQYVSYISYRVESDYYDILREMGVIEKEIPWREFVAFLRGAPDALKRAAELARRAFWQTMTDPSDSRFRINRGEFLSEWDSARVRDDNLPSIPILPTGESRAMVLALLYRAEVIQYHIQTEKGRSLSWKEYLKELGQDKELWHQTMLLLRNALVSMDFKTLWLAEDESVTE